MYTWKLLHPYHYANQYLNTFQVLCILPIWKRTRQNYISSTFCVSSPSTAAWDGNGVLSFLGEAQLKHAILDMAWKMTSSTLYEESPNRTCSFFYWHTVSCMFLSTPGWAWRKWGKVQGPLSRLEASQGMLVDHLYHQMYQTIDASFQTF